MLAYATLFAWSFLAATIVPIGSEPAVVAMTGNGYSRTAIVVVATLGNYLGAVTTYALARAARRAFSQADSTSVLAREQRASAFIARYGQPALLFSWVPLLGDALVAAAGAAMMPFVPFSMWTIVGKALRYSAVVWGTGAVLSLVR